MKVLRIRNDLHNPAEAVTLPVQDVIGFVEVVIPVPEPGAPGGVAHVAGVQLIIRLGFMPGKTAAEAYAELAAALAPPLVQPVSGSLDLSFLGGGGQTHGDG